MKKTKKSSKKSAQAALKTLSKEALKSIVGAGRGPY